jgi:hypothetical protein
MSAAGPKHRMYISLAPFHNYFYTYNARPDPLKGNHYFTIVRGANEFTCPEGCILKETGRKLNPGINPGVYEAMVSVYDAASMLTGFINPNDPVYSLYNGPTAPTYTPSLENVINNMQSKQIENNPNNIINTSPSVSAELAAMRQKIYNQPPPAPAFVQNPVLKAPFGDQRAPLRGADPFGAPAPKTPAPTPTPTPTPVATSKPATSSAPVSGANAPLDGDNVVKNSLQAVMHIRAGTTIVAGTTIAAGDSIYASTSIQSGTDMKSGGSVQATSFVTGGFYIPILYNTGFQQIAYDSLSPNADVYVNPNMANVFEVDVMLQNLTGTIFCYLRNPANPLHPVSVPAGQVFTIIFINTTNNTPSVVFQYESTGGFHTTGIMKLNSSAAHTITFATNGSSAYEVTRTTSLSL